MVGAMASSLTLVAVKYVVSMLLLSILACVVVLRRRSKGISAPRTAADLVSISLAIGAATLIPQLIRTGMDVSRVLGSPVNAFPVWAVLAAGLSFLMTIKWWGANRVAA
jgi:hypothetical protein